MLSPGGYLRDGLLTFGLHFAIMIGTTRGTILNLMPFL